MDRWRTGLYGFKAAAGCFCLVPLAFPAALELERKPTAGGGSEPVVELKLSPDPDTESRAHLSTAGPSEPNYQGPPLPLSCGKEVRQRQGEQDIFRSCSKMVFHELQGKACFLLLNSRKKYKCLSVRSSGLETVFDCCRTGTDVSLWACRVEVGASLPQG